MSRRGPSISDVAAAAGVSRAAVSKVIRNAYGVSPAMRERVQGAIDQLGYRPRVGARSMRGPSFTIGFETPNFDSEFYTQVMYGAATSLAGSLYQLIVAPGFGYLSGIDVLESLVDRQVDGIIAISSTVSTASLDRIAERMPIALLGRHDRSSKYDCVTGDDEAGANLVMDHLLGLRHRRIAHITIRPPTPNAPHAIRSNVYQRRMRLAGERPQVVFAGGNEGPARDVARRLLSGPVRPTAIFAGHDTLAMDVLRAITEAGLDPSDVSVIGYDDIPMAAHPLISLSTVDQFGVQMGAVAVELLMERIRDGRHTPRDHRVTPELRVRSTTHPRGDELAAGKTGGRASSLGVDGDV